MIEVGIIRIFWLNTLHLHPLMSFIENFFKLNMALAKSFLIPIGGKSFKKLCKCNF